MDDTDFAGKGQESYALKRMPSESLDMEMSKVIVDDQPVPHPESPVKEVHVLPSRHFDSNDVNAHHVDMVSYHEPLHRRHHHHHHHHHHHRHHRHKHRRHKEHEKDSPSSEQGPVDAPAGNDKAGDGKQPSRSNSDKCLQIPRPTQTSMYVAHSPSYELLLQRSKETSTSPRSSLHGSPVKQVGEATIDRSVQPPSADKTSKTDNSKGGEDSVGHRHEHHHHHHRRHHRHHRRHTERPLHTVATEPDEARTLPNRDLDDIATHRLQDEPGVHRRVIKPDHRHHSAIGANEAQLRSDLSKQEFDHRPHDVFIELEELHVGDDAQLEWRETARWIKYEEDVQAEADRWGKPHVASLSFHSLLELRRCIEAGTVLLDLDEDGLEDISRAVVENMIQRDQLSPKYREVVLQALLLRHVHQSDPHSHRTESAAESHRKVSSKTTDSLFPRRYTLVSMVEETSTSSHSNHGMTRYISAPANIYGGFRVEQEAPHDPHIDDSIRQLSDPQVDPAGHLDPATQLDLAGHVNATDEGTSISSGIGTDPEAGARMASRLVRRPSFHEAIAATEGGLKDLSRLLQMADNGPTQEEEDNQKLPKSEQELLDHLPTDVEGTTVLVGALDFLEGRIIAFVRLARGQPLGHVTEVPIPVRFLFIMLGPPVQDSDEASTYHEIGRSISTLMADDVFHTAAYRADSRDDLLHAINLFLDDSIVLPPGKWDKDLLLPAIAQGPLKKRRHTVMSSPKRKPTLSASGDEDDDPLARTGRFCGGMVKDLHRLRKRYISDYTDCMTTQVLTTAIFMYFGAIAPVITFGGLLGKKTGANIGLAEMLIAASLGGVFFALLSAQPLMLIGPTGPLLVFEEVIYNFCDTQEIPYFQFRFWTGMWVFVFLFAVVATDLSLLVKKFTRFTEEVFAALIGFIFIFEALKSVAKSFSDHPLSSDYCQLDVCGARPFNESANRSACVGGGTSSRSEKNQPNAALLYLILVIGTFCLAYGLRILRHSRYLSKEMRRTMSDFGILITIIIFVLIAHYVFSGAYSEKVNAPGNFKTTANRSWLIAPLEKISTAWIFAAIIPALLVAFLIFVETQVTALIVGSADHKLKKGPGFHWNLLLVAFLVIICSMFGLPWLCGTPVPSLSHTTSLLVYEQAFAPGEKPKVIGAVEQRVSNIMIHALIGITLSPPLTTLFQQAPIAVLFGVFLYLGIVSVLRLQFFHRIILLLIPPKHHPDNVGYVQLVRTERMHVYTLIQVACLGVLIVFKMTPAALVFPIMILLMVPIRNYVVTRYFSESELAALDPHGDGEFQHNFDDSVDEIEATALPL